MNRHYLFIGVIITSIFVGCSNKKGKKTGPVNPKTPGRLITDSLPPPVVTMITAANAPKIIKAAPPTILPQSSSEEVDVPTITTYTIADGLPSNFVVSSAMDRDGNLWFATLGGISKYDGSRFTNFNTANGLPSGFISRVFIDSRNNVWIQSNGFHITRFDGKSFIPVTIDPGIPASQLGVMNMIEDKKGNLWFSSRDHGLYRYSDEKFAHFTLADGLTDTAIHSMVLDKNGDLLLSTPKGICRYDGKTFNAYQDILPDKEGNIPFLLHCSRKGDIWYASKEGELCRFDGVQTKIYSKKDGYMGEAGRFIEDHSGNCWFRVKGGISKYDGKRIITYTDKIGLPSLPLITLTEDKQGNIWTTSPDGVFRISSSYLTKSTIPVKRVPQELAIDKFGNRWVSFLEGLAKYEGDHVAIIGKELTVNDARFALLLGDHKGEIWFTLETSTGKGINNQLGKFDGRNFILFGEEQGLPKGKIQSLWEDDSNNIWISGRGGLWKYDGASFTSYPKGSSARGVYCVLMDSRKNLWMGTADSGVYKYDGRSLMLYNTRDGLPDNFINDITEDPLGNIWFATDGGAARYDGKTFTPFRASEGLNDDVAGVVVDTVHRVLWFNTPMGLASLKYEQLAEDQPIFQLYNQRTGYLFTTTATRSIWIDKQGVIWGRDLNGVFRFDYNIVRDFEPLSIRIKNVLLENKKICFSCEQKGSETRNAEDSLIATNEMALKFGKVLSADEREAGSDEFGKLRFDSLTNPDFIPVNLVIPFRNNNISFEFGTISPSFGKYTQFQYKLEGYDKNWSPLSTRAEASFGNMSEGHYTFHVKALSPFGSWSETSYSFRVLPPWWRTWWAYALYAIIAGLGIFFFIRWRTRALKKEKRILEEKVTTRTSELMESLEHLKATQSQLIQSEKMASLGELTAGIAHEIQNPLNFVNNFSEVNEELLVEMKTELDKGNVDDAKAIANDAIENQQKILHHGKRADAIVKGMLQHSRTSNGVKEPTDINALCDEYFRLAYHGLRAKDPSFNTTMETDFDKTIGHINIISQDIGRVMLNLISNAFYAVNEKTNPTVRVSTKKVTNTVEIKVKDNGNGIPQKVLDKIFQPFFTTKPTGEGTGLGLSLSYDIVKAHGGEIKVESTPGQGSVFTIQLPDQ